MDARVTTTPISPSIRPVRLAVALALGLALAACGTSVGRRGSVPDGGRGMEAGAADVGPEPSVDMPPASDVAPPDAPAVDVGAEAAPPKWPGTCDPVAQNCPTGDECDIDCSKGLLFQCLKEGTGKPGDRCAKTLCVRGSTCTGASAATAVCRKFCSSDADCPAGKACDVDDGIICMMGGMSIGYLCEP